MKRLAGCDCVPYRPAGLTWRHSSFCPRFAFLRLIDAELAEWRHPVGANVGAGANSTVEVLRAPAPTLMGVDGWFTEHDRLAELGECPDPGCPRCDHIGRDRGREALP
jgi:hypothetical protein